MTTEEFGKKINEMGFYFINKESGIIDIFEVDPKGRLAGVDANRACVFDLCGNGIVRLDDEKRKKLAKVVTEYAMTPIEKRKPKRYFKYRLKPIAEHVGYWKWLKYKNKAFWLGDIEQEVGFQMIFEEGDPLLGEVNLEMFDAIEVDKEGNELLD